jgi:hypothetical protein
MNTTRKQIVDLTAEAVAFAAVLSMRTAAFFNARPTGVVDNYDEVFL